MIVLVGGGSCAGKTTFSNKLNTYLNLNGISSYTVSTDIFYKDIPPSVSLKEYNFDSEENFDTEILHQILLNYKTGISDFKIFEFKTHKKSGKLNIPPVSILIIEGIFAFSFINLITDKLLKIYIKTENSVRYKRRVNLYLNKLKHSLEFINMKYYLQAEPHFIKNILPKKN